jgi:hypothetical protein
MNRRKRTLIILLNDKFGFRLCRSATEAELFKRHSTYALFVRTTSMFPSEEPAYKLEHALPILTFHFSRFVSSVIISV